MKRVYNNQVTDVVSMMRRALNTLDYRLIDHGERVAYLVYKLLQHDTKYDQLQLLKICYLTLFHDIGAYKTEDLDSLSGSGTLFQFEISHTIEHSIQGYLFLQQHEFFEEYADAVLFHHFFYEKLLQTDCKNKDIASAIFMADRLDLMITKEKVQNIEQAERFLGNPVFNQEHSKRLKELELSEGVLSKSIDRSYLEEITQFLDTTLPCPDRIHALVHILPHAIDFRSEYTVTHTIVTVVIAVMLAQYCGLGEEEKSDIYLGALLHDVGKIAITQSILEKDSKLSDYEFDAMKDHVILTHRILDGCVSDKVLHIAVRHHEKLDGTGYPDGLTSNELSLSERIVAVADVLSALMGKRSYKDPFPEEKVKSIIMEMADEGKLCKCVIEQGMIHYGEIATNVTTISEEAVKKYSTLQEQVDVLLAKYGS